MTTTGTQLTLKLLHPSLSPAYSPNLYAWMRKHKDIFEKCAVDLTVYRVKPGSRFATGDYPAGTLMIGYMHDGDFIGVRLMRVLTVGDKAGSMCFAGCGASMEALPNFWEHYRRIGRCALDPDHTIDFLGGDRYQMAGDIRECLWCGARHREKTETVMVPKTVTTYESL